jgi:glycosyltransferase involved in cell wall biosynthesis
VPSISLVIPTLNEEKTIGECISRARDVFKELKADAEILVVDSSTDRTPEIASSLGARVVRPDKLGYGNAYLYGFGRARGDYLVLLDGDLTYDPSEIPKFLELLDSGADMVMGSRLRGRILSGAMPPLHRYIGNPLLTGILNLLFSPGISDAHCGMRAIKRAALDRLRLRSKGMEFASEMVIEAARKGLVIVEVPITYHPRRGASKLQSFSDGWRHLRFMMLYRPVPFLLVPGTFATVLGLALTLAVMFQESSNAFRMHSLILGSLLVIIGYQTLLAGLHFSAFGASYGLVESRGLSKRLMSYHNLEKELAVGLLLLAAGLFLGIRVLLIWKQAGYGTLYQVQSAMMALILSILGLQTVFSGMFISLLLLKEGDGV